MFDTILIANRGEIACRVIRTARRMGIGTVAVYSDADAASMHVRMADQAVHIGPAAATESYLDGPRIIQAAAKTGAKAIHPGYGFLSENPDFVDAVEAAGLVFIGPPAAAIRAMGLKDAAKAVMEKAGVPVVPGYHGPDQTDRVLTEAAAQIGYPVLIKAVAGGGGKGMRRVDDPAGFAEALRSARNEAQAAFGNAAVLIEKFIQNPRHIEVQVFGDGGRAVHLFERDCSLQRRHQKVIEEAPAPGMTAEMRMAMGNAAVRAAEAIGYAGAGTVEFIVDGANMTPDGFWFMEMNTRLQVEHPVTEAIAGVDLVEWQLRVAAGQPLPAVQEELSIDGHAFEARVYAEDAARGFLPATGILTELVWPPVARVDAGVEAGDAITPHYDPMIAKLVVHGPDRSSALRQLQAALDGSFIAGSTTNLGFLGRLSREPAFAAGTPDTGLIARAFDGLTVPDALTDNAVAFAALAMMDLPRPGATGFTLWTPLVHTIALQSGDAMVACRVTQPVEGRFEVTVDGRALVVERVTRSGIHWSAEIDGRRLGAKVAQRGRTVDLLINGERFSLVQPDPLALGEGPGLATDLVRAPMPGLLRSCHVAAGDIVIAGQPLAVLEAMKMEHTLKSPRDGTVAEVPQNAGAQVEDGDILVRLEAVDD